MRVLVLSNLYPPHAMGGYELSCRDVVDRWRQRGHEVTVLTTSTSLTGAVEPAGSEPHVRRELEWYWAEHVFLTPSLRECLRRERLNHAALQRALLKVNPEVVSVWHMGGMSLSLLTAVDRSGVPWVGNVCDDWPAYGPHVDAWMKRCERPWTRLVGRARRLPTSLPDLDRHAHSFVSEFTRDQVRRRTRWSFPRSTVVGSGVDPVDFPPATRVTARPWRWQLLAVGRVEPRKGFATAVQALAQLPQAHLRIAGVADPAHLLELQSLAARCGVTDRLTIEAVPRAELKELYRSADAVLFPSSWEEPFGLVPLEAMTQATPVVATRRGGSAEFLVDQGNCLEIPVDHPQALAAAVLRLAGEPELRERLAAEGLRTAARFTVDGLAEALERLHLEEATRC
jgi:glycogen(starch) synthase